MKKYTELRYTSMCGENEPISANIKMRNEVKTDNKKSLYTHSKNSVDY